MMTMRSAVVVLAALAAAAGATIPTAPAKAQGGGRYPASQAIYQTGRARAAAERAELIDAHGDPAVIPAQYTQGYGYEEDPSIAFGGVRFGTDQVGPHYFDIAMEYVSLRRDESIRGGIGFTAVDFGMLGDPPNLVLTSDSIDPGYQPGFRVTGRYDIGPLSVLEVGYTGLFDMDADASFTDPNIDPATGLGNLFSNFTMFGQNPSGGFNPNDLEDFEETDRAGSHRIAFTSDLQTAEISYRRYWVGHSPRVTGTLLAGFRYTDLRESFRFDSVGNDFAPGTTQGGGAATVAPNGIGTYTELTSTDNNLAGFQMGGDLWVGILQGLRFGAEGKAGIYNNSYEIRRMITTSDGDPFANEVIKNNQAAFISEAKLMLVADILPSMSVRGGYEVLFMNSLVLAGDNINTTSPFDFDNDGASDRVPFLLDQGNAVFHGWNVGFEYIW